MLDDPARPSDGLGFAALSPVEFLVRSANVWADRDAIVSRGETRTYDELYDRVRKVAWALREIGCAGGDRIATLLPNVSELLELHFAVPLTGCTLVPLNTRLSASECRYILEHSTPACVVVHEGLIELLREALDGCEQRPRVITVGSAPADSDTLNYDDWAAAARPSPLTIPHEKSVLSINYTSGTTGRPKGVMYTHRGAYLHTLGVIADSGLTPRSRYLWTLPMFHCHGWAYTWAVTAMGGAHVCLERFDPEESWALMQREQISHMCGAPTVLSMLFQSSAACRLSPPVRVFIGGAPPAPALIERAERLGMDVTHLYGLTETYGPLAVCAWQPSWDQASPESRARLRARQGVATVVSRSLRVVDPNMDDVPLDGETVGEVVMRGNNVTIGYYRDPEATAAAFRQGWFLSGDLGVMHGDGYVELRDRSKDIVITGGENVSTIEVEQTIMGHPEVVQAAVIGVPDEQWGELVWAYVVVRPGAECSVEDLQTLCRRALARFKVPRSIEFCESLPVTATGKVQKFRLRETVAARSLSPE